MLTRNNPTTGAPRADVRPFNPRLSLALDDLIQQLERNPRRWERRILRLRKLVLELWVPAFYGAARS